MFPCRTSTGASTAWVHCRGVQESTRMFSELPITIMPSPFTNTKRWYSLIAVFTALACWSTIHLTIRILFFFKRYKGLYFWSLIITTWMLSIREVGFLMRWVAPHVPWQFSLFLAEIGWTCMVTGYSIVLWSRLSIIVENRRVIWGVFAVIMFDGIVFHTSLWILQYGLSSNKGAARQPWLKIVNPFERVQVTVFTVQECGISALYMWGVWRLLQEQVHRTKRIRHVLSLLFVVQTITIAMDIAVCVLDVAGYFTLKAIIHSWVYGIKLELEFVVLNQLVDIAKTGVPGLKTITDDSVPDSTITSKTAVSSTSAMPSPDSQLTFHTKPEWLLPAEPENLPDNKTGNLAMMRRMSSPAPLGTGLGSIPEGEIPRGHIPSFQETLSQSSPHRRSTNLSLDSIGVIPDP
jgi:hypothetical protein